MNTQYNAVSPVTRLHAAAHSESLLPTRHRQARPRSLGPTWGGQQVQGTRQIEHRQRQALTIRQGCFDGFSTKRTHVSNPKRPGGGPRPTHTRTLKLGSEPELQNPETHDRKHMAELFPQNNRHLKGNAVPLTFRPGIYNGAGQATCKPVWGKYVSLDLLSWHPVSQRLKTLLDFKRPLKLRYRTAILE